MVFILFYRATLLEAQQPVRASVYTLVCWVEIIKRIIKPFQYFFYLDLVFCRNIITNSDSHFVFFFRHNHHYHYLPFPLSLPLPLFFFSFFCLLCHNYMHCHFPKQLISSMQTRGRYSAASGPPQ